MNETLLRNERLRPSMAVPIKVTVRMPITMPRVVSTERSLLARMAPQEMRRPSWSSVSGFMAVQKIQAPRSKLQRSSKHKIPLRRPGWSLDLGVSLELGSWCLELFHQLRYSQQPGRHLSRFTRHRTLNSLITRNQSVPNPDNSP